jgi:excinuclease UvrABC nuclease subunit
MNSLDHVGFSLPIRFDGIDWQTVPSQPGVYVIFDGDECVYVGMAGRDRGGTLRKRLKDHSSGQVVNMFAQYLFLARVQFASEQRITHPRAAKAACREYLLRRCSFRYLVLPTAAEARLLETRLKTELTPALNSPYAPKQSLQSRSA